MENFNADLNAYTSDRSTPRGRIRGMREHILRLVGLAGSLNFGIRGPDVPKTAKTPELLPSVAACAAGYTRLQIR
jgi:hypothetical protein